MVVTLAALAVVGVVISPASAYVRPASLERVSLATDGSQQIEPLNLTAYGPSSAVSANGRYIAFDSQALNLVPFDTNGIADVFVRDRKFGITKRISVASDGSQAIGVNTDDAQGSSPVDGSMWPTISANGRFVTFISHATNLVPNDTNLVSDIFVHDVVDSVTTRVSISSEGAEANDHSKWITPPDISDDGRYVTFSSDADTLVSDDDNDAMDVFVHDRQFNATERVPAANGRCPGISPTGRFVAFMSSRVSSLGQETLLYDRVTKDLDTVSLTSSGAEANNFGSMCDAPGGLDTAISANGRFVAFNSFASDLVPRDSNGVLGLDAFVHDRETGRTERISVSSTGAEATDSTTPTIPFMAGNVNHISNDGRYVLFGSQSGQIDPYKEHQPREHQFYLHDRVSGETILASRGRIAPTEEAPFGASLSPNGHHLAFVAEADGFLEEPANKLHFWDTYYRFLGPSLGIGGLTSQQIDDDSGPPDGTICITPQICIPPLGYVSSEDPSGEAGLIDGTDLIGLQIAHRPRYQDLFARIELDHMPNASALQNGALHSDVTPIVYALRFRVQTKTYEVRATSIAGGTFGLFDCTSLSHACNKIADLRGGYGTTGMRVVFSLPLRDIGLQDGGELSDVEAISALGTYFTGATRILDSVSLQ